MVTLTFNIHKLMQIKTSSLAHRYILNLKASRGGLLLSDAQPQAHSRRAQHCAFSPRREEERAAMVDGLTSLIKVAY